MKLQGSVMYHVLDVLHGLRGQLDPRLRLHNALVAALAYLPYSTPLK